jgi:diguanylate cyclase (GGDEF)-like protein
MNKAQLDLTVTQLVDRVNSLERALIEVRREADTDTLTGLGNRRMLDRRAGDCWYVYADLDGFKAAQDSHPLGHSHGDLILREFASHLAGIIRDSDHVAFRAGGDEFAVQVGSKDGARRVRDQIREWRSQVDPSVSVSAGMGRDLASADAAMFLHKSRR